MRNNLLITAAVLIIIAVVALALRSSSPANAPTTNTDETGSVSGGTSLPTGGGSTGGSTGGTTSATLKNALVVENQQPGASTLIKSVTLEKPGFIVIRDVSHSGSQETVGKILKSSTLLSRGTHTNVIIPLAMSPGAIYYAVLHMDSGNGVFYEGDDIPARDASGAVVMKRFIANVPITTSVKQHTVTIKGSTYQPASLTVTKGDIINFTNADNTVHTVTIFGGHHLLQIGQTYTIDTSSLARGSYKYTCDYHSFMSGTITVQ